MAEPLLPRIEREDFRASGDPALVTSGDGKAGAGALLGYRDLYELWERQHWHVQDIDFSRDRHDWHERISPVERGQRMHGMSSFFVGEQRVAAELGPIMRAVPEEEMRIFVGTQIADEARHVAFFDRFYAEVGIFEADGVAGPGSTDGRIARATGDLNESFGVLFDEMLGARVERLEQEPEDREALVGAVTLYHMVIEGMLGLTGQHFILAANEREGTLPGFVSGFSNVARDEHRHVAFGARFLRDMAAQDDRHGDTVRRTLAECVPVAEGVLKPPWAREVDELFGFSLRDVREFAVKALDRRLRAIGLS